MANVAAARHTRHVLGPPDHWRGQPDGARRHLKSELSLFEGFSIEI